MGVAGSIVLFVVAFYASKPHGWFIQPLNIKLSHVYAVAMGYRL
jgi:hypothetical protein